MKHSLVVPVRNRADHLAFALWGIQNAWNGSDGVELLVVDLNSIDGITDAFRAFPRLPLRWIWVDYPQAEPFNKSVALNVGIQKARGETITVVDADCIVPSNLFSNLPRMDEYNKIAYRVRYVNVAHQSRIWLENCQEHQQHYPMAYEGWGTHRSDISTNGNQTIPPVYGNSQMTVHRQTLLDLGGYDEKQIGRGYEDVDMNRRIGLFFGNQYNPYIDIDSPTFCIKHDPGEWKQKERTLQNSFRYIDNERNGVIRITNQKHNYQIMERL